MGYMLKSKDEFLQELNTYLEAHPIEQQYEHKLIDKFVSSNLSDLYQLFVDLQTVPLSEDLYYKLKDILHTNFQIDDDSLFTYDNISKTYSIGTNIKFLEEFIKDKYLSLISSADQNIDDDELYKLSLIVNKKFPNVFLSLIKNPSGDISKQQSIIKNKILNTIEHWNLHNSKEAEEENRDIAGALYISAKTHYPNLSIHIPGRIKSTRSSIININKEINRSLSSLIASDVSVGLSDEDIENQFNLKNANNDFSGFTIVLSNVDDVLHFDNSDPSTPEILKLRKIRSNNIKFIHNIENFLSNNDSYDFNILELLQLKMELLMRLQESTYDECATEYNNTSFSKILEKNINLYYKKLEDEQAENPLDEETIYDNLNEIYQLLDELKHRVHDKYQAKLLEVAIPEILNDELLTDTLKIKAQFAKNVRKPNGFCSLYYYLQTLSGRRIELQVLSKRRFEDSKNGPSDHSSLPNKEIDITSFFEPVDPSCKESIFKQMVSLLNTTPIASRNVLNKTPDTELTPMSLRLKKKLRIAEQNVKIKDVYNYEYETVTGEKESKSYPIEVYLPMFAEYVSPKLMTVSSPHTRFHKSVAGYDNKSIISEFTEVLLKHDSTTCLAQLLIDKLASLVPNDKNEVSLNGIVRRAKQRYDDEITNAQK